MGDTPLGSQWSTSLAMTTTAQTGLNMILSPVMSMTFGLPAYRGYLCLERWSKDTWRKDGWGEWGLPSTDVLHLVLPNDMSLAQDLHCIGGGKGGRGGGGGEEEGAVITLPWTTAPQTLKFGQLASKRCGPTNEGMVSKSTRWNHISTYHWLISVWWDGIQEHSNVQS